MEFFAAAAFDGTGHMFCTDFQAGVESAVSSNSFGIGKTPRRDDMGKLCNGSYFANLGCTGQDMEHFCPRQGSIRSFPFHRKRLAPDKFHKIICLCQAEIVFVVFVPKYGTDIRRNTKGTKSIAHRRVRPNRTMMLLMRLPAAVASWMNRLRSEMGTRSSLTSTDGRQDSGQIPVRSCSAGIFVSRTSVLRFDAPAIVGLMMLGVPS